LEKLVSTVRSYEIAQSDGVGYYVISIRVATLWLPALVGVDERSQGSPFEPKGGLVYEAGQAIAENQFSEVAVVNTGNGSSISQPRLHVG
jgi:hypothetical protein